MCGIVVALSPLRPITLSDVVAMTATLRHRGPDDEGYAVLDGDELRLLAGADTPAAVVAAATASQPQGQVRDEPARASRLLLGHRRLAVVDLSPLGHQPMRRGASTVVLNGEIYNHAELRVELERRGHRFVSRSDTEVLLAAHEEWGSGAPSRFNGMWAYALFDARRRRLFVSRDRFGVKPLYYWRGSAGELLLASEVKALLRHPQVAASADPHACRHFLRAGPQAWTQTTPFAGIHRFPAGHFAEIAIDGRQDLTPVRYWSAPPADDVRLAAPFDQRTGDRLAGEYVQRLDDAVRIRMRMDVRFGTALSGGLDSSQIASRVNAELARRGSGDQQDVFTSVYSGSGVPQGGASDLRTPDFRRCDESRFAALMADRLKVRSHTVEPRWQDVPDAHERMVWALDTPPANTLMSSWHTYGLVAAQGVVVTLDGQGADEQLAGYLHYLRSAIVHAGTGEALAQAAAFVRNGSGAGRTGLVALAAHALRRVAGRAALAPLVARVPRLRGVELSLNEALRRDFDTELQTLLQYADQSAMAWSIESRMPFMDWRLVSFLAEVPAAYLIHDGWTKWLARYAMRDELPAEVVWRRDKVGWAIPEVAWFGDGGPLNAWLARSLDASAFVREVAAQAGVDLRRAPLSVRLRALNLAVWQRLFFEEPGRPGRPLGRDRMPAPTPRAG